MLDLLTSCDLKLVLNSSRPIESVRDSLRGWNPDGIIGALGTEIDLDGSRLEGWSNRFAHFDRSPIDDALTGLGCVSHHQEFQTRFKVSYSVAPPQREAARLAVAATRIDTRIIESSPSNFDVIPANAGKGAAALHVARTLGVPTDHLVTAGDSANDLDLVSVGRGVVVGNATQELTAKLNDSVYHATASHAAGVIEGLRHHGVPIQEKP